MRTRPVPVSGPDRVVKLFTQTVPAGAESRRHRAQAVRRSGIRAHGGPPRAEDTGLLETDRLAVIAQPVDMVDGDRGQHADISIHDVNRIEAAAETNLEDDEVWRLLKEQFYRCQRTELEIGQRQFTTCDIDAIENITENRVFDRLSVKLYPLIVLEEVRRGITADRQPCGSSQGLKHRHDRAFAIGTSDGNQGTGK